MTIAAGKIVFPDIHRTEVAANLIGGRWRTADREIAHDGP
jgi:hypothetical protein